MTKQQFDRRPYPGNTGAGWMMKGGAAIPTPLALGVILLVALIAFEMFNFDTTRFALASLLGDVRFAGVSWAAILAVAFCAIDFAGLVRFFLPDNGGERQPEYWYLTGAWLLGATMNAIMTWWAVSLTLLNHNLGNEILSRAQLLEIVPIFVAALVWLTRILFIGAFTVAGGYLFTGIGKGASAGARRDATYPLPDARRPTTAPLPRAPQPIRVAQPIRAAQPVLPDSDAMPAFLQQELAEEMIPFAFDEPEPAYTTAVPQPQPAMPATGLRPQGAANVRIQRRPPAPTTRRTPAPMGAKGRGGR